MDTPIIPELTLSEKQRLFPTLLAKLLLFIYDQGFECTLGEAYRTPEQAVLDAQKGIGITHSEHCKRLAIDLMLFKDGVYLTTSEAYRPVGEYWKTLDSACRWGGDFSSLSDGDHFSMIDQGVA